VHVRAGPCAERSCAGDQRFGCSTPSAFESQERFDVACCREREWVVSGACVFGAHPRGPVWIGARGGGASCPAAEHGAGSGLGYPLGHLALEGAEPFRRADARGPVKAGCRVARGRAFAVDVTEPFVDARLTARTRCFAVAVAVAAFGDVVQARIDSFTDELEWAEATTAWRCRDRRGSRPARV
jgi:hypothetical protein